jgi:hypothetical protein
MNQPRIIGIIPFVDGVERDVHEDDDGRQWVTGYEGEKVYGVWLLPADKPLVVEGVSSLAGPEVRNIFLDRHNPLIDNSRG